MRRAQRHLAVLLATGWEAVEAQVQLASGPDSLETAELLALGLDKASPETVDLEQLASGPDKVCRETAGQASRPFWVAVAGRAAPPGLESARAAALEAGSWPVVRAWPAELAG
mmetsp:Transcript_20472/g.48065  ORF Transcript_20472/g.48065 Transcript_20472/m.48065 type:complete len:113 (+) Transcript_20472:397-735(+)